MQSPPRPVVPPGARSLNVDYTGPVTQDTVIGRIPSFHFDPLLIDTGTPDTDIVRPQPVLDASGQPTWQTRTETLDLTPYSPVKKALVGAGIGGAVGGALGLAVGYFLGDFVTWGAAGAGVGAAAGAGLKAAGALGDKVTPEWELRKVVQYDFNGYDHVAIPQTTTIQVGKSTVPITTGYHHHYSEKVSEHQVNDFYYWHPVAKHSADS